jgi:hypothetical protein
MGCQEGEPWITSGKAAAKTHTTLKARPQFTFTVSLRCSRDCFFDLGPVSLLYFHERPRRSPVSTPTLTATLNTSAIKSTPTPRAQLHHNVNANHTHKNTRVQRHTHPTSSTHHKQRQHDILMQLLLYHDEFDAQPQPHFIHLLWPRSVS